MGKNPHGLSDILLRDFIAAVGSAEAAHGAVSAAAVAGGLGTSLLVMVATLPLMFAERGSQMVFMAQACLLLVSGVYYPVEVMPGWMESLAAVSPATYALEGIRASVLDGTGLGDELWPLVALGVVSIPAGLAVFRLGERYAKRHGKLKRSG